MLELLGPLECYLRATLRAYQRRPAAHDRCPAMAPYLKPWLLGRRNSCTLASSKSWAPLHRHLCSTRRANWCLASLRYRLLGWRMEMALFAERPVQVCALRACPTAKSSRGLSVYSLQMIAHLLITAWLPRGSKPCSRPARTRRL